MKFRFFSARCTSSARLDGKTAVVTGCNTGIGKCTAQDFFMRGARVIMACRNIEKAKQAADDIKKECKNVESLGMLIVTELDLSSFKSIRKCADHLLETEKNINILVNNAGLMFCPESKTEDGFELQFGTNYLGPFLFTLLLLPKICQSTPARIVNVSSLAHIGGQIDFDDLNFEKKKYNSILAYSRSKLAILLFSRELVHRLKENNIKGVNVYSLHPGVVRTDLGRHVRIYIPWVVDWVLEKLAYWVMKTPEQGAQTIIYCAVDEKCADETGLYYTECEVEEPSNKAKNDKDAEKLWDASLTLVNYEGNPFKFNNFI